MSKEIKAKRIGGNNILVMNKVAPKTYEFRIRVMTPRGDILSCEKIEESREVIEKNDLKMVFKEYYYSIVEIKSPSKKQPSKC